MPLARTHKLNVDAGERINLDRIPHRLLVTLAQPCRIKETLKKRKKKHEVR
jgi:hypothetical protein